MTTEPTHQSTSTPRTRWLTRRRLWVPAGLIALISVGYLILPGLIWAYHVERAGRLMDQGMQWPSLPLSDSLPRVSDPAALRRADALLGTALAWRPDHAHAYRLRAQIDLAEGRWQEASANLERASQLAPANELIHWDQALAREQQLGTDWNATLVPELDRVRDEQLLRLWQAAGIDVQQLISRGEEAYSAQRFAEALRWFKRGIVLNPQDGMAWYYVGMAYDALQQPDQALLAYQQAIVVQPDFRDSWSALGEIYVGRKAWNEALAAYTQAVQAPLGQSNLAPIYYRIGWVRQYFIQPFDPTLIQQNYELALTIDGQPPKWLQAEIYYQQGGLLMAQAKWAAAVQSYQQLLLVDANHAEGRSSMALALWELGRRDEARHEGEMAIILDPDSVAGYRVLAVIHEREGDFSQARDFYTQMLAIAPDNLEAQTALERLKTR